MCSGCSGTRLVEDSKNSIETIIKNFNFQFNLKISNFNRNLKIFLSLSERENPRGNQEFGGRQEMGRAKQEAVESLILRYSRSSWCHASRLQFNERFGDRPNGSGTLQVHFGVLPIGGGQSSRHCVGLRRKIQQQEVKSHRHIARAIIHSRHLFFYCFRFAELSACIFINANVPVYLYSEMVATPFVSFAVRELNCLAGVMVTASHNPKEDNGYKVYWTNSAQIIAPHDKGIQNSIMQNLM